MFLHQQRVIQVTLLLLAVAILLIPLISLPEEAEAKPKKKKGSLLGSILSAILDEVCDNCSITGVEPTEHFVDCDNCHHKVWHCDNHPHITVCWLCKNQYWDCPFNTEVYQHYADFHSSSS